MPPFLLCHQLRWRTPRPRGGDELALLRRSHRRHPFNLCFFSGSGKKALASSCWLSSTSSLSIRSPDQLGPRPLSEKADRRRSPGHGRRLPAAFVIEFTPVLHCSSSTLPSSMPDRFKHHQPAAVPWGDSRCDAPVDNLHAKTWTLELLLQVHTLCSRTRPCNQDKCIVDFLISILHRINQIRRFNPSSHHLIIPLVPHQRLYEFLQTNTQLQR
ncbi:hypothetical protein IF1G_04361 [Cordyceps javanica]|uniref:Uncharacterized protein n=1 Tax=Cordyceps javanica TaxID=43265 RepID=A0A545V5X5_9HYPO|nr:hypothetical protein IF1G_04361 [Cordyceps javanica]